MSKISGNKIVKPKAVWFPRDPHSNLLVNLLIGSVKIVDLAPP